MSNPNNVFAALPIACKRWWVALSGGLDSKVLLHRLRAEMARPGARHLAGGMIGAVHLRHFLEEDEPAWEEDCRQYCEAIKVPLVIMPAASARTAAEGLEAAARQARLMAWQTWAVEECQQHPEAYPAQNLWLAQGHHANDRAETLLLRLGRGTGGRGLAVLPAVSRFQRDNTTLTLFRPLLHWRKEDIVAYAKQHGINGADDPANRDPARTRTPIRQTVLPAMLQVFPTFLKRAAALCDIAQMENEILQEVAMGALATLQVNVASHPLGDRARLLGAISRSQFLAQREGMQMLTFRHWWENTLTTQGLKNAHLALGFRRLKHLLAAVHARDPGQFTPLPALPTVRLIWQHDTLMLWQHRTALGDPERVAEPDLSAQEINVAEAGQCAWAGGQLHWAWQAVDRTTHGVSRVRLTKRTLYVSPRQSSDTFHPHINRPLRSLRKWMSERRIPIHLRAQLPMLRTHPEGALIAALGVGVQAEWLAQADDVQQLMLRFEHPEWGTWSV